jgi:hypothetical protein
MSEQVDGWALISLLMSKPEQCEAETTKPQESAEKKRKRSGWPKGKPRGPRKRRDVVAPTVEPEIVEDIIEEAGRKKRKTSKQSRNIILTAAGLFRPGWVPVKGRPLQRGKGFPNMDEAAKNRDLLEKFADLCLPTYSEVCEDLGVAFAKAIEICGWRTDISLDQLNSEVWVAVNNLNEPAKPAKRQRVKRPFNDEATVTMAQLADTKPGVGISFLQGLLGPQWKASPAVVSDVYKAARTFDAAFFKAKRLADAARKLSPS